MRMHSMTQRGSHCCQPALATAMGLGVPKPRLTELRPHAPVIVIGSTAGSSSLQGLPELMGEDAKVSRGLSESSTLAGTSHSSSPVAPPLVDTITAPQADLQRVGHQEEEKEGPDSEGRGLEVSPEGGEGGEDNERVSLAKSPREQIKRKGR